MKEDKKGLFVSIIILLVLFGSATFVGVYYKNFKVADNNNQNSISTIEIKPNPNHEFYFDNKLYFYDEKDILVGVYPCQYSYCDNAENTIDDNSYSLNYDNSEYIKGNSLINNRYIFVSDTSSEEEKNAILYDLKENKLLATYTAKKEYQTSITNNIYFVKSVNGLWGALNINDKVSVLIKLQYEYIGLLNKKENEQLMADTFVVKNEDKWAIISNEEVLLSKYISEQIHNYNEWAIETLSNGEFNLYDYEGVAFNDEYRYKLILFDRNYMEFITTTNKLFIYDFKNRKMLSSIMNLYGTDFSETALYPPYTVTINDNNLALDIYTSQLYGSKLTYNYPLE